MQWNVALPEKNNYLVLIYGFMEHSTMLATNKRICSKKDIIDIARLYFSRWCIEEYFYCKKQMFHFENSRVRKRKTINDLNLDITLCMDPLHTYSWSKAQIPLRFPS